MGSELYAYFELEARGFESDQLPELADDAGAEDVPGSGEGQVVARLDAASEVSAATRPSCGSTLRKLHFFDPDSGDEPGRRSPRRSG